jgi:hypothetical protein
MHTHMRERFSVEEMRTKRIRGPFGFTKAARVMRIDGRRLGEMPKSSCPQYAAFPTATTSWAVRRGKQTLLFNLEKDPDHFRHSTTGVEERMIRLMEVLMKQSDAQA